MKELEAEAKKTYQKTQLDDQFFSLREMEEVCQKQEEKEVDEAILDEDIMDELYGDGMDGKFKDATRPVWSLGFYFNILC